MIRKSAVAGSFYPNDATQLQHFFEQSLISDSPPRDDIKALIVPHAGYVYSGQTAAQAYALLGKQSFERVVLLGPNHNEPLIGVAAPSMTHFATPLGNIALDRAAIDRAQRADLVVIRDSVHHQEHSLEVQLPFLQFQLGEFSLIPLLVGQSNPQLVCSLIDLLMDDKTLLVVSSDLSHFHPYSEANALDRATCEQIMAFSSNLEGEQACGCHAINGLLLWAKCHRYRLHCISRCTSGDTFGSKDRVVGYASFSVLAP